MMFFSSYSSRSSSIAVSGADINKLMEGAGLGEKLALESGFKRMMR